MSIGTPDFTRSVVTAQKTLATVPVATLSESVSLPANCEALVIYASYTAFPPTISVVGDQSNTEYQVVQDFAWVPGIASLVALCAVGSSIDRSVTVTLSSASHAPWSVVSDQGVRLPTDPRKFVDNRNVQYVVPTVPNTIKGDHPPTELQCVGEGLIANGAVLAAAGLGKRYRLFELAINPYAGTGVAYVQDSVTSVIYCSMGNTTPGRMSFQPGGMAMGVNAALNGILGSGVTEAIFIATYIIETA